MGEGGRGHSCQAVPMGEAARTRAEGSAFNSNLSRPASLWELRAGSKESPKEKVPSDSSRGQQGKKQEDKNARPAPGALPQEAAPSWAGRWRRECWRLHAASLPPSLVDAPSSLSPTGLGLKEPLTPATSPANKTPSNWSLSLGTWTTAPQTSLQEPRTHLKGGLTGWPEGLV